MVKLGQLDEGCHIIAHALRLLNSCSLDQDIL